MNVATENYISEAKDLILNEDLESLEELWYSIAQVILSRSKAISYDLIFRRNQVSSFPPPLQGRE